MFLSIPKGMQFEQKMGKTQDQEDFFIDPTGKLKDIPLQQLVKEAIRANSKRLKCIELKEFTIYMKTPPDKNEDFLHYIPGNNGKICTQSEVKTVKGYTAQRYHPEKQTKYGQFWNQHAALTKKHKEQVEEERKEQKENRQHRGDNNTPT